VLRIFATDKEFASKSLIVFFIEKSIFPLPDALMQISKLFLKKKCSKSEDSIEIF
jgi:hypothetical protein